MKYPINWPLQHNGQSYQPGEQVELTDAEAAPLLAAGVISKPERPEIRKKG